MNIVEQTYAWHGSLQFQNVPVMLVLHHADATHCTAQDIHKWHLANGWCGIGYHFFVAKDGTIYRGRPENAIGAHCPNANSNSLGICAEGNYAVDFMPQAQLNAIVDLCIYLCAKYGIKQIYGHRELFNTTCPGRNYPLDSVKTLVIAKKIDKVVANMDVKVLQQTLNKLGFTDETGKPLVEDGISGQHTQAAVAKAKEILAYILK